MTFFLFGVLGIIIAILIKRESKIKGHASKIIADIEMKRNEYRELQEKKKKIENFDPTYQLGELGHGGIELLIDEHRNKLAVVEAGKEPEVYDASQLLHIQVTEKTAPALACSLHKPKRLISGVNLHVTLNSSKKLSIQIPYTFLSSAEYQTDYIQRKLKQYKKAEKYLKTMKAKSVSEKDTEIIREGSFSF